jgi:N-methylhydantoinase A
MAARAAEPDAVCLDMGGTSCDVCVAQEGRVRESGGREVGGRALALPMVDVHTVGAGGGSVAWADAGGALRVGPRSAGAEPGPACYGRGGEEPTVTDANLLLGYLDADSPLAGGVELDRPAAERAVADLARRTGLETDEAAAGIVEVAATEMARAVRVMTVERGLDPRPLALVAFGGAGPLHATAIADELGMRRVIVPRSSGVLSALGLIVSERRRDLVESVLLRGGDLSRDRVGEVVARLAERGRAELDEHDADLRCTFDLRYSGQAFELAIEADPEPEPEELRRRFDAAHEERYGYRDESAELELVTIKATVALPGPDPPSLRAERAEDPGPRSRTATFDRRPTETTVLGSEAADELQGPAIVELAEATLVVPPGWSGHTETTDGTIVLERGA